MLYGLAALAVAGFAAGLGKLVSDRFEVGDVYPPYSSLRADPLGAKALHDALAAMPELSVRRNYRRIENLRVPPRAALLMLGVKDLNAPERAARRLEEFVTSGGRLVLAVRGGEGLGRNFRTASAPVIPVPATGPATGPATRPSGKPGKLAPGFMEEQEFLGDTFDFRIDRDFPGGIRGQTARRMAGPASLPKQIAWPTGLALVLSPDWTVIYARAQRPVLAQRRLGAGSIVLAADSYFASNEAAAASPPAGLLAWLVGRPEIWFDEAHLGVVEEPGLMTLARRYNLDSMLAALAVLAALVIWKNAASFIPRDPALARRLGGASVAGQGARAALVSLLRRAVPRRELVALCLREYLRSNPRSADEQARRRAQELVERSPAGADAVELYKQVSKALSEKRHGKRV